MTDAAYLQRLAREVADEVCAVLAARDDRPLLRVKDVAARLGTGERVARRLIGEGRIPSFVVADGVRVVAPAVLDEYVRARQAEGANDG